MFTPEEATQAVMGFLNVRAAPPEGDERDEWIKEELGKPRGSVPFEKVDYALGDVDGEDPSIPFSYTMIQNEAEAFAWYKRMHPKYPDAVLRVMASGWRPAQKVITTPTRMKKADAEFSVEKGEVEVDFS